jgi:hypothetical protein
MFFNDKACTMDAVSLSHFVRFFAFGKTFAKFLVFVRVPILGIDFLRQHQLLVDVVGAQLLPRSAVAAAAAAFAAVK